MRWCRCLYDALVSRPRPAASGPPVAAANVPVSRFRRLANTHATMAAGDAAMTVALADSVLFSLDADAARGKVLLFLGISFVPFLFVAPLIGPVIDRMKGGRRFVVQLVTVVRVVVSILMAFHADDLLLFPLAFVAMVMQKTYAISKSALVPSVVRNEEELVEANSKLGLISGLVGSVAVIPAGLLQTTVGATGTLLYGGLWFVLAFVNATRLPREVVAAREPGHAEEVELHSPAVVLAATAMSLLRAAVGFTFFHLYFWFSRDEGFVWFGVSLAVAGVLTMAGNSIAPMLRHHLREELMLVVALALIAGVGIATSIVGGVVGGVVLAGAVNFAAAVGRLAFDSIVQRDAPDANQGRAFARFETRFQFGWVLAGVIPVLLRIPGAIGFVMVGLAALLGAVTYRIGSIAVGRGRPPFQPTVAMRRAVAARARPAPRRGGRPLPPPTGRPRPRPAPPGAARRAPAGSGTRRAAAPGASRRGPGAGAPAAPPDAPRPRREGA